MKTSIIASVLIIAAILLGVMIMRENNYRTAQLNEYEYLLADAWQSMDECKDQLGVFYRPIK